MDAARRSMTAFRPAHRMRTWPRHRQSRCQAGARRHRRGGPRAAAAYRRLARGGHRPPGRRPARSAHDALQRSVHDGTPGRLGSRAGSSALAARACRPGPGARPGCRAWFAPTGVARGQVRGDRNLPVDRQVSPPAARDGRPGRRASASPPARGQVRRDRNLPVDRQVSPPAARDGRPGRRASASPPARGQVLRHRNLPVDRQVSPPAVRDGRPGRRASASPPARGQVLRHRNLPVDRQGSPAGCGGRPGGLAGISTARRAAISASARSVTRRKFRACMATAIALPASLRASAASNASGNASTGRSMSSSSGRLRAVGEIKFPDVVGAPVVARAALQRLEMRALRRSRGRAERAAAVQPRSLSWPTRDRAAPNNRHAREAAGHHGPGRWLTWRLNALLDMGCLSGLAITSPGAVEVLERPAGYWCFGA